MTLPTYKIEVAFNAGVTTPAASRTWTDVTAYVLLDSGIDITYGRGDWRSTADPNTLRLTLNNSDGRFTAGRTGSPYYPNVRLGRPIRVTATVGGVSSVRFLGFVDEWPLDWPASVGTFATAQITASSRTAWLNEGTELQSIIQEEIPLDLPSAYYTLGELAGATKAADTSGNNRAMLAPNGSGITFGSAAGPTTDDLTAASFTGAGQFTLGSDSFTGGPGPLGSLFPYYAIEFFISTTATPGSLSAVANFVDSQISVDTSGRVVSGTITGPVINDGKVHHVALTTDISSVTRLYVDGVLAGTGTASGSLYVTSLTIGPVGFAATLAHVAIYFNTGLNNAARVAAHASAGLTGFAGETPAARITRYASYADIPATELSLDTGQVPGLTHLDTTGTTAVDMMRKIEATEEGILFDRADGLLGFHDRAHRYSASPSFVLDVTLGQVGAAPQSRLDRSILRNDVSAANSDGTLTAHVTNTSSIATYGPARESLDLATSNADEPFEHASWLVNQYNEPQPRIPQLTVNLNNFTDAQTQAILAAAVSTRFTVKGMPSQAATSSQDYYVEGYSESIGEARHSITFNISQAQPFDVFTIGDPVLGQYDAYPIAL
jgi:hypothetical protein